MLSETRKTHGKTKLVAFALIAAWLLLSLHYNLYNGYTQTDHNEVAAVRLKNDFVRGGSNKDRSRSSGSQIITEESDAASSSIPAPLFTPVTERQLHNGRVIQELSRRVLSRNISQSNVIIVSPDFIDAHVITAASTSSQRREKVAHNNLYPAKLAIEQGHTTHLLPTTTNLSLGWKSQEQDVNLSGNNKNETTNIQYYNSTSVSWILLAYFSTTFTSTSVLEIQNNNNHGGMQHEIVSIDDILSPSNAAKWLGQTTITYLIFPIDATASVPIFVNGEGRYEYLRDYLRDAKVLFSGLTAAQTLLHQNYKLQLLSSSHHFDHKPMKVNNGDSNAGGEQFVYGPNSLFMSVKAVHRYLYQRVMQVLEEEVKNLLDYDPRRKWRLQRMNIGERINEHNSRTLEVHFHSLLFATQGLDLAIPARSTGYTDVGQHKACQEVSGKPYNRRKTRCDPKLTPRALNDTFFLSCPIRHNMIQLQFGGIDTNRSTELEKRNGISITLNSQRLKNKDVNSGEIEVWTSLSSSPDLSEAVCVKANKNSILPSVACRTRIVPVNNITTAQFLTGNVAKTDKERPNLLFIMIDPLSRMQLKRSLPNTWALLELLGFVDFVHYTAVGNNSGPNQAALYSGMKLEGGRQDIKSSENFKDGAKRRVWLWDRLNDAGYVTMKLEDGCVSNSNMVQSIKPQTHHGEQLSEMFCYSFDRPNCLGGKLMAEYAVNYTQQFIETYDRNNPTSNLAKPWAAFLSFVDSHEDSLTLIGYLDGILMEFLQSIALKNTMIVFASDHGLHYGPTFASKSGEMERAMPQLSIRIPTFQKQIQARLQNNAKVFTSAFDVHKTILDVLLREDHNDLPGMSLLKPLPKTRTRCQTTTEIPSQFCPAMQKQKQQCQFMQDPPSVFSFYSDIPQSNRPGWPVHCPIGRNHSIDDKKIGCQCATNEKAWFECSHMSREDFQNSIDPQRENFSLRSCGNHELDESLEFNIHVRKDEELIAKRESLAAENAEGIISGKYSDKAIQASYDAQPNILFLEIDSVSLSFSERFFPHTWKLLQKHKIQSIEGRSSCPTGWCAGMINHTSVVGQNSIVNQLAALSGCLDFNVAKEELQEYKKSESGATSYCPTGGSNSLGMDKNTTTKVKNDHWIFDVAKNLGYITFFGEEFCYEESPYVVQTQSAFTLDVDFSLDNLFCRLAENWLKANGQVNSGMRTYGVEYDDDEVPDSCFDGKSRGEIALEYLTQIWDEYDSIPKFAYLNALAAHDYSLDAAHVSLSAENYDTTVFRFLRNIMERNDGRDTFIILRSDHGLQGGPYPIDYSTQIEHMRPFTTIIAPAKHPSLSIEQFASNQDRLATGFDIYHSIRYLMSASISEEQKESKLLFDSGIPPWSYNLFRESIPLTRGCKEARIPTRFCPCINERIDMAPGFYVGHSEQNMKLGLPELNYDWDKQQFIAKKLPGRLLPRKTKNKYEVALNTDISPPVCNNTLNSYIDETMLQESWKLINNITSLFPGADVSGGIFLYPRQALLLTYLVQREVSSRANGLIQTQKTQKRVRICETGFGAGHSSALFLSAASNVEVVTFDKFDRPYQDATFYALRSAFGQRLTRVVGDSCRTVQNYNKECHFIHGSSLCKTDNIDLITKTRGGSILTSTAMDSLEDPSVYFGNNAQWTTLQKNDCIANTVCFGEEERILSADLFLAKGREQTISHKFCFAVSTGACGIDKKKGKRINLPQKLDKSDFCSSWMVETPVTISTEANKEAELDEKKHAAEKNMTVTTAMKKGGEKTVKEAALALEAWKRAAKERVAAKELARKIIEEEAKAVAARIED